MIPPQKTLVGAFAAIFSSRKFSRHTHIARRRLATLRTVTARQRFGLASRAATLAAAGVLAFTGATQAAVFTKNNTAGDLTVGTSWTNGTVPGGTDIGLFNNTITAAQTDTITSAALTLGELQIVNPGGTITINGPNALTLNGIGGIGIDMSAATQNLTINAALTLGATQQWNVASGRTLAVNGGVSGVGFGVTLNGVGNVSIGSGVASTYTGTTTVNGGLLTLNYSTTVNNVLSASSALALGGGQINFLATTTAQTQTFTGTTVNTGYTFLSQGRGSGGRMTTNLGTVTRGGVGGTVSFINTSNGSTITTTTASTTGLLGGWAVYANNAGTNSISDFAKGATTAGTALAIDRATYVNDTWAAANNTTVTTSTSQTNATTNSLRFAANTASTITLTGTNIVASGGILDAAGTTTTGTSGAFTAKTSGVNDVITGGTLEGAAGADLIIHQFNTTGTLTINSAIADNTTATALTKTGPGTAILGGANTFTGGILLEAGTIQMAAGGTLNGNALTFTNNSSGILALGGVGTSIGALNTSTVVAATLPQVQNANATAATLTINSSAAGTFAGVLANGTGGGALGLTKLGTGVQTLTGASTYTGPTSINGGTLFLGAGGSISSSTNIIVGSAGTLDATTSGLTVTSGNTLSGSGSVLGAVTISGGGILSPGNGAVATLTIGSLTLNTGSITNFAFGAGNSQVATGALTLNGNDGVNLFQAGTANPFSTPGTYTLFTDTGLSGAGTFSVLNPAAATSYMFSTAGNAVTLTIASTGGVVSTWNVDASSNYNNAANWTNGVPNSAAAVATFGSVITAPRTVTVDGTFTVGEIDFNNANSYTLTPAAAGNGFVFNNSGSAAVINDISGSHTIQTPISLALGLNVIVAGAGSTLTDSGVISNTGAAGTGTLSKSGPGTLALLGANTFDGGVTITNGVVQINSASSLGAATGTATLDSSANAATLEALNSITTARAFTLNGMNNNIQVDGASTYEIDGVIGQGASGGTLTKTGPGTLTLGANNTFLGIVTVSAGTLSLGAGGTAGSVSGNIIDNTALVLNRTDTPTVGNTISGTGTLTQIGSGNTTLSAANTFTGDTVIAGGVLTLGNALALQNSTLNYSGQGGTLSFGTQTAATLGGLSGSQNLALLNTTSAAVALSLGGNNVSTLYSGSLSGTGSLTKNGTGTLTLSGANTFTGATTVLGGVVTITNTLGSAGTPAGAFFVGGASAGGGQGIVNLNGATVFAASIDERNNGSVVNLTSGSVTLTGNLGVNSTNGSSGGLVSLTGGTLTANSVTIGRAGANFAGTIQLAGSTTEGLYVNGATLAIPTTLGIGINTNTSSSAQLRLDSGSVTVGGTTTITTNNSRLSLLDINGGTFTSNDTTGAGILIGGVFGNPYAELLVRGGTLNTNKITLGNAAQTSDVDEFLAIGGTTNIGSGGIVAGGATGTTLTIALGNNTVATAPIIAASADWSSSLPMVLTNSSAAAAPTFQAADAGGTAHNIALSGALSGAGGLNKTGAGTLTLTAANSYTGVTTITGGTLNINGQFALGGAVYAGTTFNGGTLQYATAFTGNGTGDISQTSTGTAKPVTFTSTATIDTNGNAITYARPVGNGGVGGLTVTSTAPGGMLTLGGANTYTGPTTVNSTLYVNGSTTAASAVTVNNGGLLGGAGGAVNGTILVNNGGTLLAGTGGATPVVGNLTTGAVTLSSTSTFGAVLGGDASFSQLLATTTSGAGSFSITLTGTATFMGNNEQLLLIPSGFSGTFTNTSVTVGNYLFTADYSVAGAFNVDVTAVPEPSTWVAGIMMLGVLGYNRRKQIGSMFVA